MIRRHSSVQGKHAGEHNRAARRRWARIYKREATLKANGLPVHILNSTLPQGRGPATGPVVIEFARYFTRSRS